MAPARRWRTLPTQRSELLPCSPSLTDRLIDQVSFSHNETPLEQHSASQNPHSVHLLHPPPFQANSCSSSNGQSRSLPQARDEQWVSTMDEYLAASRLCREEAMACSLLAAGLSMEKVARKKNKMKSLRSTCRALNGSTCRAITIGTDCSWRALKNLLSKQFIPFSKRDNHGLHHINIIISMRSLKTLCMEGRKMHFRTQDGPNTGNLVHDHRKSQGKECIGLNGNVNQMASSIDAETCRSQLGRWEKKPNLQQRFKKKTHTVLSKASAVALEVCEILNLD